MVASTEPRSMSFEEAKAIVDPIWDEIVEDNIRRIWGHPFTRELQAGTLPIEVIKGYCIHQWHWALEINNSSPFRLNAIRNFYRHRPDLEAFAFDKAADEFGTPGPGGHQRMVDKLIEACGYTREEVAHFKCVPELRGWIDGAALPGGAFGVGGSYGESLSTGETWIPEWRKVWVEALTKHYGFTRESLIYFTSHIEADGMDHQGGEAIGREVQSHSEGNKWVGIKALAEGMVPENYRELWLERGKRGVERYLMWFDALYERYDPRGQG